VFPSMGIPKWVMEPFEKSLSGLWSVGFGSTARQRPALCGPSQWFVRSSGRELESFQTVSTGHSILFRAFLDNGNREGAKSK
jgi:hypothetical protein